MRSPKKKSLDDIAHIKLVTVGSVNPNHPLSEEERQAQVDTLNRCLSGYPKGVLIGKDITIGQYQIGEHMLTMEKVTYHIGFQRKPSWENEKGEIYGSSGKMEG